MRGKNLKIKKPIIEDLIRIQFRSRFRPDIDLSILEILLLCLALKIILLLKLTLNSVNSNN